LTPEGHYISTPLDCYGYNTSAGTNVSTLSGSATITFSGVTSPGTTTAVPIDPAAVGSLPSGFALHPSLPAYEITTTATYTAPITVCLQVPGITSPTMFAGLRILHYVNGIPVDATILPPATPSPNFATKTICARVNSLSPFVVAEFLAPTAANVSLGGRVLNSAGRGISSARVALADANGATRYVQTNTFGYFRFKNVEAGQTYFVSALHKRYRFSASTQVISVTDDIDDLVFRAVPGRFALPDQRDPDPVSSWLPRNVLKENKQGF
jgi:hypothetical protein